MSSVDVAVGYPWLFYLYWVRRYWLVCLFPSSEEQLYAVSLEVTFLTSGRASVPYKISESTAASEDENVHSRIFHSFITPFFTLPPGAICLPLVKEIGMDQIAIDSHFEFSIYRRLKGPTLFHILNMTVQDGWFTLDDFFPLYVLCYVLTSNCTSEFSNHSIPCRGCLNMHSYLCQHFKYFHYCNS